MKKAYALWITAAVMVGGSAGAIQSDYPGVAWVLAVALMLGTAAGGILLYGSGRRR